MIKAKPFPGDPSLAFVEASTEVELQRETGTSVSMGQSDPDFPFAAVVPREAVAHLLGEGKP